MTSVSELVRKTWPRGDQLVPQLDIVEDLAVEADPDRLVVVRHRLGAGGEIDDGEARMRQARFIVAVDALPVGTAMTQLSQHPLEQNARRNPAFERSEITRNSAHAAAPPNGRPSPAPVLGRRDFADEASG